MRVLHVEQHGSGERSLGGGELAALQKQLTQRGVVPRLATVVECRLPELRFGLVVQANLERFAPVLVRTRRATPSLRRTEAAPRRRRTERVGRGVSFDDPREGRVGSDWNVGHARQRAR